VQPPKPSARRSLLSPCRLWDPGCWCLFCVLFLPAVSASVKNLSGSFFRLVNTTDPLEQTWPGLEHTLPQNMCLGTCMWVRALCRLTTQLLARAGVLHSCEVHFADVWHTRQTVSAIGGSQHNHVLHALSSLNDLRLLQRADCQPWAVDAVQKSPTVSIFCQPICGGCAWGASSSHTPKHIYWVVGG
jgi:hypothetical protein